MRMLQKVMLALLLAVGCIAVPSAHAQKDPDVGNITMDPKKTLVDDLNLSPIHRKLVDAIKAAGLTDMLNGAGPFTMFAPTDDAFTKVDDAQLTALMGNTTQLTNVLKYHVVAGKLTSGKLGKLLKKGKGTTTLTTLAGTPLTLKKTGTLLILTDAKGGTAVITTPDIKTKNGYFHVIDAVLMPN